MRTLYIICAVLSFSAFGTAVVYTGSVLVLYLKVLHQW